MSNVFSAEDFERVDNQLFSQQEFDAVDTMIQQQAVQQGVFAPNGSPERAAKAIDLGKRAGVPPAVIELNIEGAEQLVQQQERQAIISTSPELQGLITSDPMAAKVTWDELPLLERLARIAGAGLGLIEEERQALATRTAERLQRLGGGVAEGFEPEVPLGFEPGGETEQFFQKLGLLRGPKTAYNPGTAVTDYVLRSGMTLMDLFGRGFEGTAGGVSEAAALLLEDLGGSQGEAKRLKREVWNFFRWAGLGTFRTGSPSEYIGQGPRRIDPVRTELEVQTQIMRSEIDQATIDTIAQSAFASKTRERAPELFNRYIHQQTDVTIAVDAEVLRDLYLEQKIVPGSAQDVIFGFVPQIEQRLAEALSIGGSVEVPFSRYVTHVDPQVHGKLLPSIRKQGGMTVEEAQLLAEEIAALSKRSEPTIKEAVLVEAEAGKEVPGYTVGGRFVETPEQAEALRQQLFELGFRREVLGEEIVADAVETAKASVAADRELQAATRRSMYLDSLFEDQKSTGMTISEYNLYAKRIEDVEAVEHAKAVTRATRLARRELGAEWKEIYEPALVNAERTYDARPEVIIDQMVRNEGLKLDLEEAAGRLPLDMVAPKGTPADELAELAGFASGEELIEALATLRQDMGKRKPENYRKMVTREAARIEASKEFGDLTDRMEMAIDAAVNDDVTKLLYDDLRVMRLQPEGLQSPLLTLAELQGKALETFGRLPVAQAIKFGNWQRAVIQAGRKAYMALLKNDVKAAFKAKHQQLMAQLMLKEAVAFKKEYVKTQRLARKYVRTPPKSVDGRFADQAQLLLAQFGVPLRRTDFDGVPDLQTFVTQENFFNGTDIPVDPEVLNNVGRFTIDTMDAATFHGFGETLKSLDHLGRQARKLYIEGKKVDVADAETALLATFESLPLLRDKRHTPIRSVGRYLDSYLVKIERLFDRLENWEPEGPWQRYVMRPLQHGEFVEAQLLRETVGRLPQLKIKNARKKVPSTFVNTRTGRPYKFNRGDLVMMALNAGNRRNRDLLVDTLIPPKLDEGAPLYQAERQVRENMVLDFIKDNMTPEDWVFADRVWATFAWLKPQIDRLYLRVNGVAPETVQGIDTLGHKGGYFPIMRDAIDIGPTPSDKVSPFELDYHKVTVPNRYVRKRTQNSDPIMVETAYEQLPHWIRMMVHDLAMREPVMHVHKILRSGAVRQAVATRFGQEYSELIPHWLRHIANGMNQSDREIGWFARLLRASRQNLVIAVLSTNFKTILSPQAGFAVTHPRQTMWVLNNYWKYRPFALSRSEELVRRQTLQEKEVTEMLSAIASMEGQWGTIKRNGAFYGMAIAFKLDTFFATDHWLDQFGKAMAEGMTVVQAALLADKRVRDNFGSISPVNRAKLYSSGEFLQQIGLLGGYMNTMYNRTHAMLEKTAVATHMRRPGSNAGARRAFDNMGADAIAMVAVPIMLTAALYTDFDEDDGILDYLLKPLASYGLGFFPVLRDVYNVFEGRPSTPNTLTGTMITAAQQLMNLPDDDEDWGQWLIKSMGISGQIVGLPTGQLSRSTKFVWNIGTGQEDPEDFWDWARGIIHGTAE